MPWREKTRLIVKKKKESEAFLGSRRCLKKMAVEALPCAWPSVLPFLLLDFKGLLLCAFFFSLSHLALYSSQNLSGRNGILPVV